MYRFCRHLQQLQTNGVDPLFSHVCGQCQPPEPIEQVVGKSVYLQTVRVDHFGVTTYRRKIESAFSFLYEVLHLASAAVKLNNLIRLHLHRRDDECEQVYHLSIGLLDLEDHSSRMRPAA